MDMKYDNRYKKIIYNAACMWIRGIKENKRKQIPKKIK